MATTIAEAAAAARSLTQELTDFVETVMDSEKEISVDQLIRLAERRFKEDPWMVDRLIQHGLATLIPTIAGDVKHYRRTLARRGGNATEETRRLRIASVFEHVGSGHSKSLLEMNRQDHLFAAEEREVAAAGHLRWANFHRAVAKLHKDDKTLTGELPPARVASLFREHIED